MPYAKIQDVRIYYELAGNGPPLVLVTGVGGNASFWSTTVGEFLRQPQVQSKEDKPAPPLDFREEPQPAN